MACHPLFTMLVSTCAPALAAARDEACLSLSPSDLSLFRSKNVKFCAYSIPHPNDKRILMQIQVYQGRGSALQALQQGLTDLLDASRHVKSVLKVSNSKRISLRSHVTPTTATDDNR